MEAYQASLFDNENALVTETQKASAKFAGLWYVSALPEDCQHCPCCRNWESKKRGLMSQCRLNGLVCASESIYKVRRYDCPLKLIGTADASK